MQGGSDQTLYADRERPNFDADLFAEHRIGDQHHAVNFQQNGAMSQPRGMQTLVGPARRVRPMRRWEDMPRIFPGELLEYAGRSPQKT